MNDTPTPTPTPRTDAEACWPASSHGSDTPSVDGGYVDADFSRTLECELTASQSDNLKLRAVLQKLVAMDDQMNAPEKSEDVRRAAGRGLVSSALFSAWSLWCSFWRRVWDAIKFVGFVIREILASGTFLP